ncbi:hypothetical protein GRI40_01265 [Altererythrobacter aerius]|uniref:Mlr4354 like protein n=1 Tax=Tsuneonella aeria TaxID=1837929 RepID=A0A6I4T9Q6_9SPHN|nr:invasion associated locus B family protein [Tsuneonella aeria]MXO73853.1 hypothetical protein [Tsuneonella aeria]
MNSRACLAGAAILLVAMPAVARDSLGVYDSWGAFRDPAVPRCYAIAKAQPSKARRDAQPFAAIGYWPTRGVRGQVSFSLSRSAAPAPAPVLRIGNARFDLKGSGRQAWASDKSVDAAIVAAMRAGATMSVSAWDTRGNRFTDRYRLEGAATAMDAATVGCARLGR